MAGGEILRMVPPARMRTDRVDGAAVILQKRAGDIARGVLERRERQHGVRVVREAVIQRHFFLGAELAADVVGDQENLVRQHVHAQRAADRATGSAGERHFSLRDDPGVQVIEGGKGAPCGGVELLGREGAIDVFDELVQRIFGHPCGGWTAVRAPSSYQVQAGGEIAPRDMPSPVHRGRFKGFPTLAIRTGRAL